MSLGHDHEIDNALAGTYVPAGEKEILREMKGVIGTLENLTTTLQSTYTHRMSMHIKADGDAVDIETARVAAHQENTARTIEEEHDKIAAVRKKQVKLKKKYSKWLAIIAVLLAITVVAVLLYVALRTDEQRRDRENLITCNNALVILLYSGEVVQQDIDKCSPAIIDAVKGKIK